MMVIFPDLAGNYSPTESDDDWDYPVFGLNCDDKYCDNIKVRQCIDAVYQTAEKQVNIANKYRSLSVPFTFLLTCMIIRLTHNSS